MGTYKSHPSRLPAVSVLTRLAALLLAALASCTQGGGPVTVGVDPSTEGGDSSTPRTFNPAQQVMRLERVFTTASDPQNQLDLIGDGTGQIGQYCRSRAAEVKANGIGESTCKCVYYISKVDVDRVNSSLPGEDTSETTTEQIEVNTVRFEDNMIRCPYRGGEGGFPVLGETVNEVSVMIGTDSGFSSNPITLAIIRDGNQTIIAPDPDPSSPGTPSATPIPCGKKGGGICLTAESSFVNVQRYQCREHLTIMNLYDARTIYDPFQSEHVRNSYAINYYTTSMGTSMLALGQASSGEGAEDYGKYTCAFRSGAPEHAWWQNERIYSKAPRDGNYSIYPYNGGGFDRSKFYLARQPMSPFIMPVNAFIAPGAVSETPGQGAVETGDAFPPLGYAAKTETRNGKEYCPEDLPHPSGWEIVKIWAFRGSLPVRTYATLGTFSQARVVADIACDPGQFTGQKPTGESYSDDFFKSCGKHAENVAGCPYPSFDPVERSCSNPSGLVSRALLQNVPNRNYVRCAGFQGPAGQSGEFQGADLWKTLLEPSASSPIPPWNFPTSSTPFDDEIMTADLDLSSRFDFIFVVTPPDVQPEELLSPGSNQPAVHAEYVPFAVTNRDDCNTDGNPFADSNCTAHKARWTNYELFRWDITTDAGGSTVFPICTVRKKEGG